MRPSAQDRTVGIVVDNQTFLPPVNAAAHAGPEAEIERRSECARPILDGTQTGRRPIETANTTCHFARHSELSVRVHPAMLTVIIDRVERDVVG